MEQAFPPANADTTAGSDPASTSEKTQYGSVTVIRTPLSAAGTGHGIGGVSEEDGKKIHDMTGHETPSFDEPLDPDLWEVDYTNTRLKAFPRQVLPLQQLEVRIFRDLSTLD